MSQTLLFNRMNQDQYPVPPYVIGVLAGEGIGPEIIQACLVLLQVIQENSDYRFEIRHGGAIGLIAQAATGQVLTEAVKDFCAAVFGVRGAVLCGPGGGRFVYELRKQFDLYCKLVPIIPHPLLRGVSSIKADKLVGVDILIVRENVGGIYQGEIGQGEKDGIEYASHQFRYDSNQIKRILQVGITLALARRKKLCLVLKPGGVPAISALWKACAEQLVRDKDLQFSLLEVDYAAYQLITDAKAFDVVVAPNMLGDILADGTTVLLGSRGLSYSANFGQSGQAVYQTGHGAAYDLAGLDRANPLGQLFSLVLLLRESFGLNTLANQLTDSITAVLEYGWRTADIWEPGCIELGTQAFTQQIAHQLKQRLMTNKPAMRPALVLLDLQQDFLARLPNSQSQSRVIKNSAALLQLCRQQAVPVLHVMTQVKSDGSDRMPHWQQSNYFACVEGTHGVTAPEALQPHAGEPVFFKHYFNAFHQTALHQELQARGINSIILCGLFLHGCIRATAISAYEHAYQVWIADDAVESTEPMHAQLSKQWLASRVARFCSVQTIQQQLRAEIVTPRDFVSAVIGNQPCYATQPAQTIVNVNPCDSQAVYTTLIAADEQLCQQASVTAEKAWRSWRHSGLDYRAALLARWLEKLLVGESQLVHEIVHEIGKPWQDARAELTRAIKHLKHTLTACDEEDLETIQVRHRPNGVYAMITPWNNPVAIPISKIAPALLFGNTVVWKPATQCPRTSKILLDTLIDAGLPDGVVNMIFGEEDVAQALIMHPAVRAVSITGAIRTGKKVSRLCARLGKPLQAELGGNNPCIILADVDLATVIDNLVLSAFSFSGQRCTATRRFIVVASRVEEFSELCVAAMQRLQLGPPQDKATQIGPLVNVRQLLNVETVIADALSLGACLLAGGKRSSQFTTGFWFEPTLLTNVHELSAIVQQETFGPVALIQTAVDIEDAVRLANNVPHGLLASLLTQDASAQTYFKNHIEAGIIKLNPDLLAVEAHVPFGGWKESQLGPPEHGDWDKLFYTRPQTVYA